MIGLKDALNRAYKQTGLPAAYAIWETTSDYLFFMVAEGTSTNEKISIGSLLTAVSKKTGRTYLYDIFDHQEDFSSARRITSMKRGDDNG